MATAECCLFRLSTTPQNSRLGTEKLNFSAGGLVATRRLVIGICGGTGSGKTTITDRITARLNVIRVFNSLFEQGLRAFALLEARY